MKDLATIMTQYDWELYTSVPEQEVLNKVFGRCVYVCMCACVVVYVLLMNFLIFCFFVFLFKNIIC